MEKDVFHPSVHFVSYVLDHLVFVYSHNPSFLKPQCTSREYPAVCKYKSMNIRCNSCYENQATCGICIDICVSNTIILLILCFLVHIHLAC